MLHLISPFHKSFFKMIRDQAANALVLCVLFAATLISMPYKAHAQDLKVPLATLDWEPYTGLNMPGGGAISALITEVFKSKGYTTNFGYWPWKRTIIKAWRGQDGMVGYFPGYHCHHNPETDFVATKPIVQTQLGFVHLSGKPLPDWKSLKDLGKTRIGYVVGYASTDEFDTLEKSGTLFVQRTINDVANLKKLAKGQLDAVLIDLFVFKKLINTTPELEAFAGAFKFSDKHLDTKPLHLCLRNDEQGRALRDAFNEALVDINADAFVSKYFQSTLNSVNVK